MRDLLFHLFKKHQLAIPEEHLPALTAKVEQYDGVRARREEALLNERTDNIPPPTPGIFIGP